MISFMSMGINFVPDNKLKLKNWIKFIISSEGKLTGDITYVFCDDVYLGEMNEKYLHHHTLTDIITFDYSEKNKISGDICISVERVRENAGKFEIAPEAELGRVMAHGILHLLGYKDKSTDEKAVMRNKEDYYLRSYPNTVKRNINI